MRAATSCRLAVAALALAACGQPRGAVSPAPSRMTLGACDTVRLATRSSEDIVVAGGVAFISSDPGRTPGRPRGAIYAYDLARRGAPTAVVDSARFPDFHPHGMGLFTGENGERRLFVVNHRGTGDVIEIFRVNGAQLEHVDSVHGPLLRRGNDVVPVGPRSFYVTNSHTARGRGGMARQTMFKSGYSYVLFHDGAKFSSVAQGLTFANGVNVSADGTRLYVTTSKGRDLRAYDRRADGSLSPVQHVQLATGPDNIDVDSGGGLWVATHRNLTAFGLYAAKLRKTSPSQVLYFPRDGGRLGRPQLVAERSLLPATSVAVRHGNRLLIGTVSDHALDCELAGGPPR